MNSELNVTEVSEEEQAFIERAKAPKKTKGELFKEKHGYSRTFAKNASIFLGYSANNPILSAVDIIAYKAERKKRKKKELRLKQKKHEDSNTWMRTKGKSRTSKHAKKKSVGASAKPYKAPKD